MPRERYIPEDAYEEAQKLRAEVEEGRARTYTEAEQHLELEKLKPAEDEKHLWAWLETADKSIQTILKRLNRIAKNKFSEYKLRTSDSCSGHIKADGSLEVLQMTPTVSEQSYPHLMFFTQSKAHQKEMAEYFRKLFRTAIDQVNREFGEGMIAIKEDLGWSLSRTYLDGVYGDGAFLSKEVRRKNPARRTYAINYEFPLGNMENSFPILKKFWEEVETSLTEIDDIHLKSSLNREDFLRP